MLLTMADAGFGGEPSRDASSLLLHGPPGLTVFVNALRTFISTHRAGTAIDTSESLTSCKPFTWECNLWMIYIYTCLVQLSATICEDVAGQSCR